MLIIAHRGASLQRPENTINAFHYAADNDADVIEMDVRRTSDGIFVIFHDETLRRVNGSDERIIDLSYREMSQRLTTAGRPQALSIDSLGREYQRTTPLLFHIKFAGVEPKLTSALDRLGAEFYVGVESLPAVAYFSQQYGKRRTLGFISRKEDGDRFVHQGAGIIRLWEHWLDFSAMEDGRPEPAIAHLQRAGAAVWIMTKGATGTGMTDSEVLTRLAKGGADGALLNDVDLGRTWKQHSASLSSGS